MQKEVNGAKVLLQNGIRIGAKVVKRSKCEFHKTIVSKGFDKTWSGEWCICWAQHLVGAQGTAPMKYSNLD